MFTVLIAGLPRSGSTWLFNAAKAIVGRTYENVQAVWVDDYVESNSSQAEVVKLHQPDTFWQKRAEVILLCNRDLRDIASSMHSMQWAGSKQNMIDAATAARSMHDFWAQYAALDMPYNRINLEPAAALIDVASALRIKLTEHEAELLAKALPRKAGAIGASGYDKETLLHPGHVTNGQAGRWREDLNREVAEAIWGRHGDWLERRGYTYA